MTLFKKKNPLNIFKWRAIIYLENHFNKIKNCLEAQIFCNTTFIIQEHNTKYYTKLQEEVGLPFKGT